MDGAFGSSRLEKEAKTRRVTEKNGSASLPKRCPSRRALMMRRCFAHHPQSEHGSDTSLLFAPSDMTGRRLRSAIGGANGNVRRVKSEHFAAHRHVRLPQSRHLSAFETFAAFASAQVSPGSDTPVAACCGVDSQLIFPVSRPQCN